MKEMSIPTTFSIDFISDPLKESEFTSKVRARIYYKGGNKNGTWITEDFAEKLNMSVPHVPIVGTYNPETDDFEDHEDKGNKKAYGFVPSIPNMSWEVGPDGKEYFTTDIILWTGYWPEASKIVNKSQSMELAKESIMGDWKVISGEYYFVYQNAAFKGLCTLGDTVLPCFESSAFYALDEESRSFFQSLNKINEENLGGGSEKMTDENTNNTETVDVTLDENSATILNVDDAGVNTATDTIVVDNTQEPAVEETPPVVEGPTIEEQFSAAIQTIEILQSEKAQFEAQINELNTKIATQQVELEDLQQYKAIYLKNEKLNIIEGFKKKLSDEDVEEFVTNIDGYTAEELRIKLSVVLAEKTLKEDDSTPSQPQNQFVRIPDKINDSGISSLLKKHKKN